MKIAKIPQPWASLLMTESIEFILPLDEEVDNGEIILIYATDSDKRYREAFEIERVNDLWYNEIVLGNLEESLPTAHFLGYVKALYAFPRKQDKIYVNDVHCFERPVYSNNARPTSDILTVPCKKNNYETITFQGNGSGISEIVIPLGKEAWENLIKNEEDVVLYWNEEFRKLTNWIDSFKDDIGYMDEEFNVYFKHEDGKVVWSMLNDDIQKTFAPIYETNKKTGGKTITGTIEILRIGVTDMECYYPDRDLLDQERKRLLSQNNKEKPEEHREWVHIIYTPMGNKR